jgi:serine/threonine protein kinase
VLRKLGKYELIQLVGRGAMGEVYKAHDPLIGRLVAVKTINSSFVGDSKLLERFYQEARSAGTLQHPNIVTIYELGSDVEVPFIAMEFLGGSSLDKIIAGQANLSVAQKVSYLVAMCRALDYAHKRGVIHRDIKPANVMVAGDGRITVVDFGIARLVDRGQTQSGAMIGTIPYMSPEQLRGERADARSDIWALGITAYELLCGRRPFEGGNYAQMMMNIVDEGRPAPRFPNEPPVGPTALETLVERMLRKNPAQRIQTAEEVLLELEPIWKGVRSTEVSSLIASAEEMIQSGEPLGARDVLRRALQLDGASERARLSLEQVHSQLQKSQINPQILDILDRGKTLLQEGRIPDAVAAGETALRIDSNFAPTKEFIAEVQRAVDLSRATMARSEPEQQVFGSGEMTETTQGLTPGTRSGIGARPNLPSGTTGSPAPREYPVGRHDGRTAGLPPGRFAVLAEIRRYPALAAVAFASFILLPGAAFWIHERNVQAASSALQHAEQLESQKLWPRALSEYQALANGRGSVALEGRQRAGNLSKLLAQEQLLWGEAETLESSGDSAHAAFLYQQIAALHGDREDAARAAGAKLVRTRNDVGPKTGNQDCQLPAPDLPGYLDMADKNRADGKYADAEREYNSVLICDPGNARARRGLLRAKQAKALPGPKPTD